MDVQEFRDTGHRVVDLIGEYLERIEERPLFPDVEPEHLTALFDEPLPQGPTPARDVLRELTEKLLPHCTHVNHPGYLGLITPSPNPMGILGDFLASALNQNLGTYTVGPAAIALERRTIRWLNDLIGYDERAGGNLTSGGTMANFIGVKLARDWASGDRAQHDGLAGRWAVYASEERHVAVDKAVDAVGAGRGALRVLPTDDEFRLRLDALEEAIARDTATGVRPMCIVAISGTTNTGALDPLPQLRAIADRQHMWLHADAAYGGGMLLSHRRPHLLEDLKLADSVTIDPHKWFYAPLDAGAVLVRDAQRLTASFGMRPPYLTDEMDDAGERYQYFVHGFEQSRRFRGLKVWMSFKRYGAGQIGRWIDANVEQAQRLFELCDGHADFRPAMRPPMSAICVRYDPGGIPEAEIGRIHREVARRIEAGGRFWISTTVLKDRWWFRINPVNLRTRPEHMDELMNLLVDECAHVAGPAAKEYAMSTPTRSPRIAGLSWGRLDVEGRDRPYKDAKLYPGGSCAWDWNETGTGHDPGIQPGDVEELLEHGATVVVLSTGMYQRLGVCPETLRLLEDRGIPVHVLPTEEAVTRYNELAETEPAGALIHSTC